MPHASLELVSLAHLRITPDLRDDCLSLPHPHALWCRRTDKYTKYKCQGDPQHVVLFCDPLDQHGVKPKKVFKRAGLAGADWNDPASVNALFVASTKVWPRTVHSDSDADADADADDYAAGAAASADSD
jgi:hypothetical protein